MLRRYTPNQAAEKIGLDQTELRFLLLHFREFLALASPGDSILALTEDDLKILQRAYMMLREEQMDPNDIRTILRAEAAESRMSGVNHAKVLSFVGGRSGIGKSSIIWNLAHALAALGMRCVIFDGSQGKGGIRDMLSGEEKIACEETWQYRLYSGVRLIRGEQLVRLESNREEAELQLRDLDSETDFVLVDTGYGRSDDALHFARVSDEIVALTTPDVGANAECFGIIRMLKEVDPDLRISVAINRAQSLGDAREAFSRIDGAATRMGITDVTSAGWIAEDDTLQQYAASGKAIVEMLPTSPAARCVARIADHFTYRLTPQTKRVEGGIRSLVDNLRLTMERNSTVIDMAGSI